MIGRVVPGVRKLGAAVVENGDQLRVRSQDFGLIVLLIFLVIDRKTPVEQQAVGVRAGPFGHRHEAGRRRLDGRRFGRDGGRNSPVAAHLVLLVVVVRQLVLRRHLRRNAAGNAADVPVVDTGAAGVRHVPER